MLDEAQDEDSVKTKKWIEVKKPLLLLAVALFYGFKGKKMLTVHSYIFSGFDCHWRSSQLSKLSSHTIKEMGL